MVTEATLIKLKVWFEDYVNGFISTDESYNQNILLKRDHTYRVCQEIIGLGESLNLSKSDLALAESMALLHDVGRFEQYDRYRTFADSKSEDHAQLGIKILKHHNVLEKLKKSTADLILRTISLHNRAFIPPNENGRSLFFNKLLRDADKLDIFYVVTEYYHNGTKFPNESIELDLPKTPYISEEVYKDIISEKIVNIKHIKNLNDFKLLQMAWIYDINFPLTFRLVQQRQYLEKIRDVLPISDKTQTAYTTLKFYLEKKQKKDNILYKTLAFFLKNFWHYTSKIIP